jgi:hypothetical protein
MRHSTQDGGAEGGGTWGQSKIRSAEGCGVGCHSTLAEGGVGVGWAAQGDDRVDPRSALPRVGLFCLCSRSLLPLHRVDPRRALPIVVVVWSYRLSDTVGSRHIETGF